MGTKWIDGNSTDKLFHLGEISGRGPTQSGEKSSVPMAPSGITRTLVDPTVSPPGFMRVSDRGNFRVFESKSRKNYKLSAYSISPQLQSRKGKALCERAPVQLMQCVQSATHPGAPHQDRFRAGLEQCFRIIVYRSLVNVPTWYGKLP